MEHLPKVSIVMPTYNAMPHLVEAIDSIICQSFSDWELLVVNDGSTDESASYLASIDDPRVKVLHQSNSGVSAARNSALEIAQGEYIVLTDADDFLPEESLRVRVDYLDSHPGTGLVLGGLSVRDSTLANEISTVTPYFEGRMLPRLVARDERVCYSNYYMFRRCLLGGARFKVGLQYSEDQLFAIQLASAADIHCGFVPVDTYWYRRWNQQLTTGERSIRGQQDGFETLVVEVSRLSSVSLKDQLVFRHKLARCMLLDWLSIRKPATAVAGFFRVWLAELFKEK